MKLIPFVVCIVVVLLLSVPEDSEATRLAWFLRIATAVGVKLVKNSYYARCNVRNVPTGISCPSVAFGVGLSRNQAQNSARVYADLWDSRCGCYVGHCDIRKFRK